MGTLFLLLLCGYLMLTLGAYLLRDTPIQRIRLRTSEPEFDLRQPFARRTCETLCETEIESGNRIEVFDRGDELFDRLVQDLRAAQRLITWQVFWFKPGQLADRLAVVLEERARAGVQVLMLFDQFGKRGLGKQYLERLRASGVETQVFRPLRWNTLYKAQHRSHVRSIVIDGCVGYTGGFGVDDRWCAEGHRSNEWRDTHVRLEGPAVDRLQSPFVANWAESTGELLFGADVLRAKIRSIDDGHMAGTMYCSPSLGSTKAERLLTLTLAGARRTLFITSAYFVPARGLRHLLCDASRRGVDVRILTAGDRTDRPLARSAGRAHYEELIESGVRIYEYLPNMLHAKTIVVDRAWSTIGSLNFDNRSLKLNDEVVVVVQDDEVGRRIHEIFITDLQYAREVTLESLRARSRLARVREHVALLAAPLL